MALLHAAAARMCVACEILLMCGLAVAVSPPSRLLRRELSRHYAHDGGSSKDKHTMVIGATGTIQDDHTKIGRMLGDVRQAVVNKDSSVTEGTKVSILQLDEANAKNQGVSGNFFVMQHSSGMCATMHANSPVLVMTYKCDANSMKQLLEKVDVQDGGFQLKVTKLFPACVGVYDDGQIRTYNDCPADKTVFKAIERSGGFILQTRNGKCIQPRELSMYPTEYTGFDLTSDCESQGPKLFKMIPEGTAIPQVSPYFVLKHKSGECVTKSATNDLILTDSCNTSSDLELFQKKNAGDGFFILNFKNSQECIHPFGGAAKPDDNTHLTAFPECPVKDKLMLKEFAATSDGFFYAAAEEWELRSC